MNKEKFDIALFPTSESAKRMLHSVSEDFYEKSYVGKWIYQVMGLEWDEVKNKLDEIPYQFFPETATWGLIYHEIKWGLPVRENLSYEERRKLIYQKRDYRAPMTPYRMEEYLNNATGFKTFIADINDPGEYGWQAPHPNVFKVYFMGEGTLNSKKAYELLNRLKQSHTTYTINDRTEIEANCRDLEKIILQKIVFRTETPFWNCYIFDGTWKLDGSVTLNTHRRYNLVLGFKYNMGDFDTKLGVALFATLFKTKVNNQEKINARVRDYFGISFWNARLFDGAWILDGLNRLDAVRSYGLKLGIKSRLAELHNKEYLNVACESFKFSQQINEELQQSIRYYLGIDFWHSIYFNGECLLNGKILLQNKRKNTKAIVISQCKIIEKSNEVEAQIITKTRDYWFLDGRINLSGTRNLNSIYREEII